MTTSSLVRVLVKSAVGWRGKFYDRGLQSVPPDLAAALGYDTSEDAPEPTDPDITPEQLISDRVAALQTIYFGPNGDEANWRPIKQLADAYKIAKPVDGWDLAIEAIATHEQEQGMLPVTD